MGCQVQSQCSLYFKASENTVKGHPEQSHQSQTGKRNRSTITTRRKTKQRNDSAEMRTNKKSKTQSLKQQSQNGFCIWSGTQSSTMRSTMCHHDERRDYDMGNGHCVQCKYYRASPNKIVDIYSDIIIIIKMGHQMDTKEDTK